MEYMTCTYNAGYSLSAMNNKTCLKRKVPLFSNKDTINKRICLSNTFEHGITLSKKVVRFSSDEPEIIQIKLMKANRSDADILLECRDDIWYKVSRELIHYFV